MKVITSRAWEQRHCLTITALGAVHKPHGLPLGEKGVGMGGRGVEIVGISYTFPLVWRYNTGKVKRYRLYEV